MIVLLMDSRRLGVGSLPRVREPEGGPPSRPRQEHQDEPAHCRPGPPVSRRLQPAQAATGLQDS